MLIQDVCALGEGVNLCMKNKNPIKNIPRSWPIKLLLEYHQQASAKIIEGLAEKYEKQKTN